MRTETEIKEYIINLTTEIPKDEYVKAGISCFVKALEWVLDEQNGVNENELL